MSELAEVKIISIERITKVALATWRLNEWLSENPVSGSATVLRHVARQLNEFVLGCGTEWLDPRGSNYDAGLSTTVVARVMDPSLPTGACIIHKTLIPILFIDGVMVNCGQIVLAMPEEPVPADKALELNEVSKSQSIQANDLADNTDMDSFSQSSSKQECEPTDSYDLLAEEQTSKSDSNSNNKSFHISAQIEDQTNE